MMTNPGSVITVRVLYPAADPRVEQNMAALRSSDRRMLAPHVVSNLVSFANLVSFTGMSNTMALRKEG